MSGVCLLRRFLFEIWPAVLVRRLNGEHYLQPANAIRGSILLLAMVFLLILGFTANSLLQSSTLAIRMATNFHQNEVVMMSVVSIARDVGGNLANFDPAVSVGHVRCLQGSATLHCDAYDLDVLGASGVVPGGLDVEVLVSREAPFELLGEGLNLPESAPLTASEERYAVYQVEVRIVGDDRAGAGARVVRGVAVRQSLDVATEELGSKAADTRALVDLYWTESGIDAF